MSIILSKDLEAYGYKNDPERFKELLADFYNGLARSWTVDELLCNPVDSLRFCDAIRKRIRIEMLPDAIILRTLLNMRKRKMID